MIIGFTGTRNGLTVPQERKLSDLLSYWLSRGQPTEFHHGVCVGSDTQAHNIVCRLFPYYNQVVIHLHRPLKTDKMGDYKPRAWDVLHEPKAYLKRNDDIVRAAHLLIATPKSYLSEGKGGGTWYTIRKARQCGVACPRIIILPNGIVTQEDL